jgi:hypothetical protein
MSSFENQTAQDFELEDDAFEIDLNTVEPHKFNWFKYLIDKHLEHKDEDGNESALHTTDSYINLLNIVTSQKSNEEIQEELLDLVGFHNFPLLEQLLSRRQDIRTYCDALTEKMKEEQKHGASVYRGKNMSMAPPTNIGVTVIKGAKKGKKGKLSNLANQYETQKLSNYDLLKKLGFDD